MSFAWAVGRVRNGKSWAIRYYPVNWVLNWVTRIPEQRLTRGSNWTRPRPGLREASWTCITRTPTCGSPTPAGASTDFRGDRRCNIDEPENRDFQRNAYRVLLTRARQGMVIFLPAGSRTDKTPDPAFYDSTYNYLCELGIRAPC